jgi:large subunit ribosomal protein L30
VRSKIGLPPSHRATLKALGLRRIRHTVEHDDTPTIRGMLAKVPYCIEVKES